MTTNFKDFKPEELLGKFILYQSGSLHNSSQRITTIVKVTSTGFRIKDNETLFNSQSGNAKGVKNDSWSSTSCILLTNDEARELIAEWKRKREIREMQEEFLKEIPRLNYVQLIAIKKILEK